ncbi:MAG: hypothetical protein J6T15_05995 [Bacilli bacterium]|nr:hypothetical protein [Bacilli bacterium]
MKGAKKALLPCLFAIAAGLTACGGNKKNNFAYDLDFNVDVKGQKISLWNPFGSDISEILEDLCGEFTRLTGVNVEVEDKTGYDTLRDAVTKSATSGKYCNVVFGYPDHFAAYVKSDIIVRLDYYFENDVHNSTFEPDGVDFKKSDFYGDYMVENETIEYDENGKGYTLGVPFNKSTEVLIYNQTFFDWCAANVDTVKAATNNVEIKIPETYAELETVGQAILDFIDAKGIYNNCLFSDGSVGAANTADDTKSPVLDLSGIYKAGGSTGTSKEWFKPFSYDSQSNLFITTVRQMGGKYTEFDKETKKGYVAFDNQQARDGMSSLLDLYNKNIFGIPADWGEAKYGSNPFKAWKTVMTVGSSAGVANSAPAGNKFKIAAAPVLYRSADKKFVISQGTNLALLDRGSREERVASWQLIKFLSKYANGYFCSQTGYYPSCEYAELAETAGKGMWKGYDDDKYFDYATWRSEASTAISTSDRIKAQTADVNINYYINKGLSDKWVKFVDPAFAGSSDIRDAVAAIPQFIFTKQYGVDDAIKNVSETLRDYWRN